MDEKWICGDCDFGWDLLGEYCCNKHNNEACPYPCSECPDFKEIDCDNQELVVDEKEGDQMVQTFVETSLELHKMLAVVFSRLIFAYLFLRICNYVYDLISRHIKNVFIKIIVSTFILTNVFDLILTLIIVAEKSLVP